MSIGFGSSFPPAERALEQLNSNTSMTNSNSSQSLNLPKQMNESQIQEILQHEQIMSIFLNAMSKQLNENEKDQDFVPAVKVEPRLQNLPVALKQEEAALNYLKEDFERYLKGANEKGYTSKLLWINTI